MPFGLRVLYKELTNGIRLVRTVYISHSNTYLKDKCTNHIQLYHHAIKEYLCVSIDVPEVKLPCPISAGKDGWMYWAPLYVIHILCIVLKRAQRVACFILRCVRA